MREGRREEGKKRGREREVVGNTWLRMSVNALFERWTNPGLTRFRFMTMGWCLSQGRSWKVRWAWNHAAKLSY